MMCCLASRHSTDLENRLHCSISICALRTTERFPAALVVLPRGLPGNDLISPRPKLPFFRWASKTNSIVSSARLPKAASRTRITGSPDRRREPPGRPVVISRMHVSGSIVVPPPMRAPSRSWAMNRRVPPAESRLRRRRRRIVRLVHLPPCDEAGRAEVVEDGVASAGAEASETCTVSIAFKRNVSN